MKKKTCQNSTVRDSSGKKSNFKSSSPKNIQDFNRWLALLGNTRRASGKKKFMQSQGMKALNTPASVLSKTHFLLTFPLNETSLPKLCSYAAWTLHPSFPHSRSLFIYSMTRDYIKILVNFTGKVHFFFSGSPGFLK